MRRRLSSTPLAVLLFVATIVISRAPAMSSDFLAELVKKQLISLTCAKNPSSNCPSEAVDCTEFFGVHRLLIRIVSDVMSGGAVTAGPLDDVHEDCGNLSSVTCKDKIEKCNKIFSSNVQGGSGNVGSPLKAIWSGVLGESDEPKEPGGTVGSAGHYVSGGTDGTGVPYGPRVSDVSSVTDGHRVTDGPSMTDGPKVTDEPRVIDELRVADGPSMTDGHRVTDRSSMTDGPRVTGGSSLVVPKHFCVIASLTIWQFGNYHQ